ncbi:MAG: hypothetical protein K8S18_04480 [Desulfobacula sp.]|nr:hypothetical protein [Desulfobacula sp.]
MTEIQQTHLQAHSPRDHAGIFAWHSEYIHLKNISLENMPENEINAQKEFQIINYV